MGSSLMLAKSNLPSSVETEMDLFLVAQSSCCEKRAGLFLIGQKICFMTLVLLDGILEVSSWSGTKLSSVFLFNHFI